MSAVKRYNNVQLDGKPMKIEIVGTNIATPAMPPAAKWFFWKFTYEVDNEEVVHWEGLVVVVTGGRGFGRGCGRGRGRDKKFLAEDLDADLEKYLSEAMQIN